MLVRPLFFKCFCHYTEHKGGSWQATRVVKPNELGKPAERLKDQITKLELFPQKGEEKDLSQP